MTALPIARNTITPAINPVTKSIEISRLSKYVATVSLYTSVTLPLLTPPSFLATQVYLTGLAEPDI